MLRSSRALDGHALAVVMLRSANGELLRLPASLLSAVCEGLQRAGDLSR
jgi:hypothetical protein